MRRILTTLVTAAFLPLLGACGSSPTDANTTALASVTPTGGAVGVDPAGVVTVKFTNPIMAGMEQYAALQEGDVTGPVVVGTWTLSTDRTVLTFTPAAPLKSKTKYTIHLGGGMMDANGHGVNMDPGKMMGGQYASGGMMGSNSGMMGTGWQGASGNYGMIFSFTTA